MCVFEKERQGERGTEIGIGTERGTQKEGERDRDGLSPSAPKEGQRAKERVKERK